MAYTGDYFPGLGQSTATGVPVPTRVVNPWGTPINATPPAGTPGKYIFTNTGPFPLMTFAQLQFIKAEAAFIKGDKATALAAYRKGIEAAHDFAVGERARCRTVRLI